MEKEVMYHAEITSDPRYGWSPLKAVMPCATPEEAEHEALYYLQNWPRYLLRIVKVTREIVFVIPRQEDK